MKIILMEGVNVNQEIYVLEGVHLEDIIAVILDIDQSNNKLDFH